jgi:hypothetical protein
MILRRMTMANDGYIKKSDAEEALWALRKGYRKAEEKCAVGGCIIEIQDLPTVDAVEVVRCKDCDNTCSGNNGLVCTIWGCGTYPDSYCSYGERKDNDQK